MRGSSIGSSVRSDTIEDLFELGRIFTRLDAERRLRLDFDGFDDNAVEIKKVKRVHAAPPDRVRHHR